MHVVDLTHTIAPGMPVYPGTQPPTFSCANTWEQDGFHETLISFYTHTGTHMDPPAHLFPQGITLDRLDASHFVGSALTIDCSAVPAGGRISLAQLAPVRTLADQAEFILFYTGWDRHWGTSEYFGPYPCIEEGVADYLLSSGKKGMGLDTISIDPITSHTLPLHKKVLGDTPFVILENLTNLSSTGTGLFTLCALPLKLHNGDGAPIRAVALLP